MKVRSGEEGKIPFGKLFFVHQGRPVALVDAPDSFEELPGEALREKLSRQIKFLGFSRVALRCAQRAAVKNSFGNPLNRVDLLPYSIHLDDEVSNNIGKILLNWTGKEGLDVPPHLHDNLIWRVDGKGILANNASEVGFVHEQKKIVEAIRLEVDVLEQLVRIDRRQDICCIGVCRSGGFGGDEKQSSEIRIDDISSQPPKFGQHLDKSLPHQPLDEPVHPGIVHVRYI